MLDNVFVGENIEEIDWNFDLILRIGDPRLSYVLKGKFCRPVRQRDTGIR